MPLLIRGLYTYAWEFGFRCWCQPRTVTGSPHTRGSLDREVFSMRFYVDVTDVAPWLGEEEQQRYEDRMFSELSDVLATRVGIQGQVSLDH